MEELFRANADEARAMLDDLAGSPDALVDVVKAVERFEIVWDKFKAAGDQVTPADVATLSHVGEIVRRLKAVNDLRLLHASLAYEDVIGTSCLDAVPKEHQAADPVFFKVCGVINAINPDPLPVVVVNNVDKYAKEVVDVAHRALSRDCAHGLFIPKSVEQVVGVYIWRV
jgi:hypothetical protein